MRGRQGDAVQRGTAPCPARRGTKAGSDEAENSAATAWGCTVSDNVLPPTRGSLTGCGDRRDGKEPDDDEVRRV